MKQFRYQQNRPKKNTLLAGFQVIIDALNDGPALERIYLQGNLTGEDVETLKTLALEKGVPVNRVPVEKLNSLNIPNHRGYIAAISKIKYLDLQDTISFIVEQGQTPLFLMLDGITDIRNIGGMARTAYCCGVHALIIPEKGVGALNEDAISTSAGALEEIAVCRVPSLLKAIDDLHLNGIRVLASEMTADTQVYDIAFTTPTAIIMGSEDKGVSQILRKVCDDVFRVPMAGNFESLNVSAATAMILYEAMKQRLVARP
ncbi:MAG: 23S rRNA (guanosine(2251)-2'-O)-methyltransferase RlmB [Chitinophagaceae bacterium]